MFVYTAKSKLDELQSKESNSTPSASSSSSSASSVSSAKASTTKNGANKTSSSSSKSCNGGRKSKKQNGETSPVPDLERALIGGASVPQNLPCHLLRLIEEDLSERRTEIEKHAAEKVNL